MDKKALPVIGFGPDAVWYMKGYYNKRNTIPQKIYRRTGGKIVNKMVIEPKYVNVISNSFKIGYNLLDFSASYGDGSLIAKSIKKSGVGRENIMITTRVSNKAQYENTVVQEIEKQLQGLDTDYVDILMFHWPVPEHFEDTWLKMIEMKEKGLCRMVGVANCNIHHLQRLQEISGIYPEVDQVEIHPLFSQVELRNFCKENDIWVQAYTPTARHDDRLYNPRPLKLMSEKYKKSITQLILRWHIQNGATPITRSLNTDHLKENFDIFDFNISEEDMALIDGLNINARRRYDPDNCDFRSL